MNKEKSRAQILRDTIKHLILNNLNEHEWLIESKLYNAVNEQLRDFHYKNNDIVVELRKLVLNTAIYKTSILNGKVKHYYYILVPSTKRKELRETGDHYFNRMRAVMLDIINVYHYLRR